MRITSGIFKSRIIKAPKDIRPTLDNVRKSIFDILADKVEGARVLDLYAGSGAFGLEAISRGANSCIFADNSRSSVKAIRDNIEALKLPEGGDVTVICADSLAVIVKLRGTSVFDLIFLDPPYYKLLAKKSLSLLGDYDILAPAGIVIAEHSKHDELPARAGGLVLFRSVRYGDTMVSFYQSDK